MKCDDGHECPPMRGKAGGSRCLQNGLCQRLPISSIRVIRGAQRSLVYFIKGERDAKRN